MTNLLELGATAGAAALAVGLGLAFWPHVDRAEGPSRAAISQPIFVNSPAPAPRPTPTLAAATASDSDPSALAKLAVALKIDPSATAAASDSPRPVSVAMTQKAGDDARRISALGLVALATGDIAGARLYLERAAKEGDARALLALGESYDPVTLARMGALGVKGEPAKARGYYAKALAAGMSAARERIAALEAQ